MTGGLTNREHCRRCIYVSLKFFVPEPTVYLRREKPWSQFEVRGLLETLATLESELLTLEL